MRDTTCDLFEQPPRVDTQNLHPLCLLGQFSRLHDLHCLHAHACTNTHTLSLPLSYKHKLTEAAVLIILSTNQVHPSNSQTASESTSLSATHSLGQSIHQPSSQPTSQSTSQPNPDQPKPKQSSNRVNLPSESLNETKANHSHSKQCSR